MAYQTGNVTSTAGLISTIQNFAQANGWTLSGGVLSNGDSHVKLTDQSDSSNFELRIIGSLTANFSSGNGPTFARIVFDASQLPATYDLFTQPNPDALYCVVNYNVSLFQWLAFGTLEKYGTFTGGEFYASSYASYNTSTVNRFFSSKAHGNDSASTGALFWNGAGKGYGYGSSDGSFVHCELDGATWCDGAEHSDLGDHCRFPLRAGPLHVRQPNQWNSQASLIPFWLWKNRPDSFYSCIGRIPHIRALRIDNYDPGDIITIGADRWMVFPWIQKNAANRDGGSDVGSGTFGWAIAYDGP